MPNGEREWCYVIETEMRIGSLKKTIDLTLVKQEEAVGKGEDLEFVV